MNDSVLFTIISLFQSFFPKCVSLPARKNARLWAAWRSHPSQGKGERYMSCVRVPSNSSRNCPRSGVAWDNLILAERVRLLNPFNLFYVFSEWFVVVSWKCFDVYGVPYRARRNPRIRHVNCKGTLRPLRNHVQMQLPLSHKDTHFIIASRCVTENINCSSKGSFLSRDSKKKKNIYIDLTIV